MASGRLDGIEFDLHGRDGRVRRVLVSATAVRNRAGRFVMSNSVMHDITELHETRRALQQLAGELETRVAQRTQELRGLAAELDAAESRERRQLARDLHDDLGQTLAAARLHLGALGRAAPQQVQEGAARVAELIDQANRATRSLAAQLAPPMLDDLGLPDALEWLGEEIQRSYGLKVTVVDDGQPKPLTPEARSILYRATRELLINAAKHARSESAEVEIERADDTIVVRVRDNGVGFDASVPRAAKGQGLGLPSVRERLAFIGGRAEVTSIPGDGTLVTLSAPLAPGPVTEG
jgi:signal transduction histidine kinase